MTSRISCWALGVLLLAGCQCGKAAPVSGVHLAPDAGVASAKVVPTAPAPRLLSAIVLEISGSAQVLRQGTSDWVSLALGDPVRQGDAVRTSEDGEISLGFGTAKLHMQEGSRLDLQLFQARLVRAQVQGSAEAMASNGSPQLQLTGPGGALATLAFGKAALRSDGTDAAAIAALEGKLTLTSGGQQLELGQGSYSLLERGHPWGDAARLPKHPVLTVAWPPHLLTNQSELTLQGRAGRLMRVYVQGHAVAPDPDGTFEAPVHLRRGRQRVRVVGVDVLGRRLTRSKVITMDPDAPTIRARVEFR